LSQPSLRCTATYSRAAVAAAAAAAAADKEVFIYNNYNIKSIVSDNTLRCHVMPHALNLHMGRIAIKSAYLNLPIAIPAHVN